MDLRIRRTQKNIREAFFELAQKKKISRITIKELAQTAMINKATFYLHYHDLEDLVQEIEDDIIEEIMHELGMADLFFRRVDEFFKKFTQALLRNQQMLYILYDNDRTSSIQKKLVVTLRRKIVQENPELEFDQEMDIVLTFMLRGVMDVSLYEEFQDRDSVVQALSNTIQVVTSHYRERVYARRRQRSDKIQ